MAWGETCSRGPEAIEPMLIHWYWPYAHEGTHPFVLGTIKPGDQVVIQALRTRYGQPIDAVSRYEVVRDLPEAWLPKSFPAPVLAAQRALLYRRRSLARQALLTSRQFDVTCLHHLNRFSDWYYLDRIPKRIARVSFVHDVHAHEPRVPALLEYALHKRTYDGAGEIIVYHECLRQILRRDFAIPSDRVHVLRHPLRPPTPGCCPPKFADRLCALFFGTFRANKGLECLLAAASILRKEPIAIHIAGQGRTDLEALVAQAARELPNVTCEIGRVSNERMKELLSKSHLVVLPYTRMSSQSGVLADAYSYALPLIVTDVGALGHTVREDNTGMVVPPGSPSELAAALRSLAAEPVLIHGFSKAIHVAAGEYSYDKVGARLRCILERAVLRAS